MLYDFGAEEDPLCIAQASLLLTYHNSCSDQLQNSTWLAIAVQHARSINAHQYYCIPEGYKYRPSDLKRLWWSIVIRDRIISLGTRRAIQIMPDRFDCFRCSMTVEDLQNEIDCSEVYDSETKAALCKVLNGLCELVTALTTLLAVVYSAPAFQFLGLTPQSEIERCYESKELVKTWERNSMLRFPDTESNHHPSVMVFTRLTWLYYQ